MDKFIVSARKYRPQLFNTVVGQSHITTTLKNAIKNNQLAHAFLFCGPRGVGKTTCARILAKTINCQKQTKDGEACNECNSCVSFNEGTSLNIHELDAASNNSVDDIRSLVDQVRFAPQAGKYKVYIVDEVHMLSTSAFNAFLKTLEEPPPYAIFILATTEKHKILPTILSRCQIFDFKRISTNDTVEHLQEIVEKEKINAEKSALQIIAQKSEGCLRDSLSILDKIVSFTNAEVTYQNTLEHLNILDDDYYFKLLDNLINQELANALLLYDEINNKGFEGDLVINGFAEFIRNLLVSKDEKSASLLDVVEGLKEKYIQQAEKVNPSYLVSALNILNEAEVNFKMARNKRLHVELVLIKLNFLKQAIDLTYDQATATVVRKKSIAGPIAIKSKPIHSFQPKTSQSSLKENKETSSKLYIEQEKPIVKVAESIPKTTTENKKLSANKTNGKKSLLDAIKHKNGIENQQNENKEIKNFELNSLQKIWFDFAEHLKNEGKHSVYSAFNYASLSVIDEAKFLVTVNSVIQQKFIDQEKISLLENVWNYFNNKKINFDFEVDENITDDEQKEKHLTSREKYQIIIEENPLVKELKERLNLNLEY
jgi:DNA polymerase-3 subunit gamma/tau